MEGVNTHRVDSFLEKQQPTAGPNHAASALCYWAVLWCLLCAFLLLYGPLHTVVLGGCFQKDAYSLQ
jgi:hypothetical protein